MSFSHLLGNETAKATLENLLSSGLLPQVLLFTGPAGVGKKSFALAFAKRILQAEKRISTGAHPDLYILEPEGKAGLHPMSSIKQWIEEASIPPFESKKKVCIFDAAEKMLPTSSNALLKTLEEPFPFVHILLLSSQPEEMLPTILSRCFRIPFFPIEDSILVGYLVEEKNVELAKAQQAAFSSHGSYVKAQEFLLKAEDPARRIFIEILRRFFLEPDLLFLQDALAKIEKGWEKQEESILEGIDGLLEDLLYWIRDLHLLQIPDARQSLFHEAHRQDLLMQLARGFCPSIDKIHPLIDEVRLGIQRSIKPRVVLFYLFSRIKENLLV